MNFDAINNNLKHFAQGTEKTLNLTRFFCGELISVGGEIDCCLKLTSSLRTMKIIISFSSPFSFDSSRLVGIENIVKAQTKTHKQTAERGKNGRSRRKIENCTPRRCHGDIQSFSFVDTVRTFIVFIHSPCRLFFLRHFSIFHFNLLLVFILTLSFNYHLSI